MTHSILCLKIMNTECIRAFSVKRLASNKVLSVKLVIADCAVDYVGRLNAHLPRATRLLMVKADGSVLIHSDGGSYKPLNWMTPPCTLVIEKAEESKDASQLEGNEQVLEVWNVVHKKTPDALTITIFNIIHEHAYDLGLDPGLVKEGVEAHLQALLAENITTLGTGFTLIRREYPTAIGPVDILAKDQSGKTVAIEIKRRGEIDGVEQLSRYVDLLNRDPHLAPVVGIFAAQEIKPQARTLAKDRGFDCVILDYEELKGTDHTDSRLF